MTGPLPLMEVSHLLQPLVLECEPQAAGEAVSGWAESGLVVRIVRGRKMRTWEALFDEFAAALQFPWYFGENGDAFDECLADLGWLPPQSGYVIVMTSPIEVLVDEDSDALARLLASLTRACEEWAQPVELGEWWDRPPVPFHVVLHAPVGEASAITRRWVEAGAGVIPFPV